MIPEEHNRLEYLHNYIITTHILCIFFLVGTIVIKINLSPLKAHVFIVYFLILSVFFLVESIILHYFKNNINKNIFIEIIYISFPLVVALVVLFSSRQYFLDIKYILLAPTLIAGSIKGKKAGFLFAFISTGIIIISHFFQKDYFQFASIIESNFILICIMFLVGWFSGAVYDIELDYRKHLFSIANTDYLTGLYNHRYLQEGLGYYFNNEKYVPLSLIIIDIDNFKDYNDIYGHLKGDDLINSISQVIKENTPGTSFSARYGGDEFAIVLPEFDSSEADKIAENIRKKIEGYGFNTNEYKHIKKITVSCGIASRHYRANTSQEVIKNADQALYKAKSLNKNRVELYSSIFDDLLKTVEEEEVNLIYSFHTLLRVINAKDKYTYGHSERVMEYSFKIGIKSGLDKEDLTLLRYAAFLHDIGKIEIDRNLLNKPTNLNDQEFKIFKNHCRWGYDILKAVPHLNRAAEIILYHHENYNGSGYLAGLRGEEIPLLSRIIRIADSYDAMTSSRPYRNAIPEQKALDEIKRGSGTMYDPDLVKLFVEQISDKEIDK
ncbi:MAG: diguanylate cyclase [Clostridiales bacterium]|nr:diguanylate cyclase [Clostridiales bacterium]MCF8022324.1 diguanylate cyclase [Clostridiales bacterium]